MDPATRRRNFFLPFSAIRRLAPGRGLSFAGRYSQVQPISATLSEGASDRCPFPKETTSRRDPVEWRRALGLSSYPDLGYSDILGLGYSISQFGILSVELNRFAVEL
jgi:hypothetical protein